MAKIAVLTGATSKLGPYIAKHLSKLGYQVIAHYYSAENKAFEMLSSGDISQAIQADFSDLNSIDALVGKIYQHCSKVDLLVNNAAIFQHDTALHFDVSNLQRHIDINALACIRLIQQIALKQNADLKIVNMLDLMTQKTTKTYFSYNLSKRLLQSASKLIQSCMPDIKIQNIYLPKINNPKDLDLFIKI